MARKTSRRRFIGQSAAVVGAGVWAGTTPKSAFSQDESALNSLTAACIGVGGKGGSDTSHIAENGVKIKGLCDVDALTLEKKGLEFTEAEKFSDFREMLDKLGDKVDIVTVSTPDHNHACAALKAMRMGKHIYCQKPLTWSLQEARMMRETAEKMGVVTQMGNQGTSENGLREAVEVVRSGAIGDVEEIHIWTNRPVWPQGSGRPEGSDPIPEHLNWEAWIGTAPMRPYKEGIYHSFKWRGWLDFGTGALGDMACHTTNMPVIALQLFDPIAVTAQANSGLVDNETFPAMSRLKFEFGERDGLPPCHFFWYDGGTANLPPKELLSKLTGHRKLERFQEAVQKQMSGESEKKTSGSLLVGTKGMLFSPDDYGAEYFLFDGDGNYYKGKPPEQQLPRIPHKAGGDQRQKWEFVNSCKGVYEPGTMSNFSYAGRLTETILIGNLALRAKVGERIEWDAKNLRSTNVEAVNEFVGREYREGWEVEEPVAV